jgi:hypothetical protein
MLVLLALLIGIGTAYAEGAKIDMAKMDEYANSSDYHVKVPGMLMRGATNIVLSPGEFLHKAYKHTKDGKPVLGTLKGVGYGAQYMMDRGGRGVVDVGLCLAPKFHGFPPKNHFPSTEV